MRFTSAFCPGERVLSNPDSGSEVTLGLPAVREKIVEKTGSWRNNSILVKNLMIESDAALTARLGNSEVGMTPKPIAYVNCR
jgi:hypothetical protein